MAKQPLPSPEVLRQLLDYDPETGKLFWNERPASMFANKRLHIAFNSRFSGKEAFTAKNENGYYTGTVMYHRALAHRLIWAIVHLEWPASEIDHINCNPADNRIINLRSASRAENLRNIRKRLTNTSGYKGVKYNKANKNFNARIKYDGVEMHLGVFPSAIEAAKAYDEAAVKYHGAFARPNFDGAENYGPCSN